MKCAESASKGNIIQAAGFALPAAAQTRQSVEFPVEGGALSAVMFIPAKTPAPAVIVLHTKGRGTFEPADERFAERLAGEGFVAVAVNYGDYDLRKAKGITFPPNVRMPVDVAAEFHAAVLMLHGDRESVR